MLNLKELRKKRKLTQADLAEIVGVSQVTMGRYETGEREMPYETLFQLADYFGVTVDEILGRKKMDVMVVNAEPPLKDAEQLEMVFEPGGLTRPDDIEKRMRKIIAEEFKKRGF